MATVQRGRPGPRRTLTDEVIVEAAVRLLDRGGPDAVSIRGIATEIGVAPNALYTYFPDKAAVLRAVADQLIGEYDLDALADPAQPWRQRLHDLALSLRSRLLAHPGAAGLLLGAPMDGPRALALGEALLGLLAEAGLDESDTARASYLLIVYVLGSIALEAAELEPTQPAPPEEQRVAARRAAFEAVPADAYPLTAAGADVMSRYITTDQFRWGLDRVLDGLAGPTPPDRGQ